MAKAMYDDQEQYEAAQARVDSTPELQPYEDIIMYDWQEGPEHWEWIAEADVDEIIEWADGIRKDEALDEIEDEAEID